MCSNVGYGHFGTQKDFERCVNCDELLEGGRVVNNLYRIEQVSTQRANRITSDEEERQRQGYEMITTLRFAEENERTRVEGIPWKKMERNCWKCVTASRYYLANKSRLATSSNSFSLWLQYRS